MNHEILGVPLPPYDLLYGKLDLAKEIGDSGTRLLIPRVFLQGVQRREEYEAKKRKRLEAELDRENIGFLIKNPIIVCAITTKDQLTLAIVDGHHRMRFSGGKYKINQLPCLIITPAKLVEILNKNGQNIDEESHINKTFNDIGMAIQSFEEHDQRYIPGRSIPGIRNIEQLKQKFKSF